MTEISSAEVKPMLEYREHWRFISSWNAGSIPSETFYDSEDPLEDGLDPVFLGCNANSGCGCRTAFGKDLKAKYK